MNVLPAVMEGEGPQNQFPDYINYLLAPDSPLDFQINIGDPETSTPETFGVVKLMLIARSKVLRAMLLESQLKHKGEFNIPDLDPTTFKNFLVYLYGFDNTPSLSIEEAVKLLTAAEKYDVPELKKSLGDSITPRVTPDNLFVVLRHAPVCEKVPQLWSCITDIIQRRTDKLFSHDEFLVASPKVVLHIAQQGCLSVPELDVWRAMLKWATNRVTCLDGAATPESVRATMLPLLKYTRLCTLSGDQLVAEVLPTRVLTNEEFIQTCLSVSKQEQPSSLQQICNNTEKRCCVVSEIKTFSPKSTDITRHVTKCSTVRLATLSNDVELDSVVCYNNYARNIKFECMVRITQLSLFHFIHSIRARRYQRDIEEERLMITVSGVANRNEDFTIPLHRNSCGLVLRANCQYEIEFLFSCEMWAYVYKKYDDSNYLTDDFSINLDTDIMPKKSWSTHIKALHYRVMAKEWETWREC